MRSATRAKRPMTWVSTSGASNSNFSVRGDAHRCAKGLRGQTGDPRFFGYSCIAQRVLAEFYHDCSSSAENGFCVEGLHTETRRRGRSGYHRSRGARGSDMRLFQTFVKALAQAARLDATFMASVARRPGQAGISICRSQQGLQSAFHDAQARTG